MQRAQPIAVSCCLALLIACTNSSTDGAPSPATATVTVTPTGPTTTTMILQAPTDCREAPQLPACRPGHGVDRRN